MNVSFDKATLDCLSELSDEQAGRLFKAIKLHCEGIKPELDFNTSMAFIQFESQIRVPKNIDLKKKKDELFALFWDMYGYKVGKKNTQKKWNRLDIGTMNLILTVLPSYILSTPEIRFRKQPLTYLNGEHWNDDIKVTTKGIINVFTESKDDDVMNVLADEKERNRREAELLIKSMHDERV